MAYNIIGYDWVDNKILLTLNWILDTICDMMMSSPLHLHPSKS